MTRLEFIAKIIKMTDTELVKQYKFILNQEKKELLTGKPLIDSLTSIHREFNKRRLNIFSILNPITLN